MAFEKVGVEAVVKGFSPYMRDIGKMEDKTTSFGSKIGSFLKKGALAGGAALAGLGVASLKMGLDFEKSLAEVRTLMPDISDKVFGKMRKDVLNLSKTMGIASDKAVPALYQAISAGVPKENVMEFLETSAKLAIGGVADLETAIDLTTTAINAFGLEVEDAERVADVLFTGVKLGKTTIDELGASLFQVAPAAAASGVSIEDVTAALATLTASGTPTSVAATQIRQAIVELGKEGTNANKAFQDVAGIGFRQFIEGGGDLGEVMALLTQKAEDENVAVSDLFGSVEAGLGVQVLAGEGAEKFAEALEATASASGASNEAFETMSQTASFKLNKAINAVKVTMTDLGSRALPVLVDIFEKLIDFIEKKAIPIIGDIVIGIADFVGWLDRNKKLLGLVAGAVTVFLIPAIAEMTQHVWANVAALAAQSTAMIAANPILLALVATIALLGAAYVATDEQGRNMALGLMEKIGELEARVFHAVLGPFGIDPLFGRIIDRLEGMQEEVDEFNQRQKDAAKGSAKWADQTIGDLQAMTSEGKDLGLSIEQIELAQLEKMAQELAVIGPLMTDPEIGPIWSAAMEEVMRSTGLSADEVDKLIDRAVELTGASEEGAEIIRENLTTAIDDLHLPVTAARDDLIELTDATGEIPEPVDKAAEAFTIFQEDVGVALQGVGEAIQGVLPTIDEEFAAWDARLAEMAGAYTNFQTNLETILSTLVTAHVQQPELIIQALADAGPGVTQAMATHLAENPVAAVDQTLANLGIVVGANIEGATAAVLQQTPAFQAQVETLAAEPTASFKRIWAAEGLAAYVGADVDAAKTEVQTRVLSFSEEMARLAREAMQAFKNSFARHEGETLAEWIKRVFEAAAAAARAALKASSPSRVFMDIGHDISLGLAKGIKAPIHEMGSIRSMASPTEMRDVVLAPQSAGIPGLDRLAQALEGRGSGDMSVSVTAPSQEQIAAEVGRALRGMAFEMGRAGA